MARRTVFTKITTSPAQRGTVELTAEKNHLRNCVGAFSNFRARVCVYIYICITALCMAHKAVPNKPQGSSHSHFCLNASWSTALPAVCRVVVEATYGPQALDQTTPQTPWPD